MSIVEEDFKECEQFFLQSFPCILSHISNSLGDINITETPNQRLDLICLFLDIVGTECLGEINTIHKAHIKQTSNHPTSANLSE